MAPMLFGVRIFARFALAARLGVMRVPGAPIAASETSVRIVIHATCSMPLFGRMKLPM